MYDIPDEGLVGIDTAVSAASTGGGGASQDLTGDTQNFTNSVIDSFTCSGSVPLECYKDDGNGNIVITHGECEEFNSKTIFKGGCYIVVTTVFLSLGRDFGLLTEWISRSSINLGACRNVWSHIFANNWINGTLYMPSFNKRSVYPPNNLTNISTPKYEYCRDIVVYNNVSNNFYYRSSSWSDSSQEFIGKEIPQPPNWITLNFKPGYNDKNIMFPTTILDMGPRDSYISEICNNPNFKGYMGDQFRSTSYNENGDIIQLGFLSRILNENFRQVMIPITTGGNNSEGKGIAQFFNSSRGGDRIDGDFAQALSINSEFRINPFIDENYGNSSIFIGDDGQSPLPSKPVFGVFYSSSTLDYAYRRKLTPGIEIYNISPLLQDAYGYPKTQVVPNYKWILQPSGVIFGAESNNWWTSPNQSGGVGFFKKGYQSLDYTADPYFTTPSLQPGNALPLLPQGFITNFIQDPLNPNNIITSPTIPGSQNAVNGSLYLVGAPSHFYFGLNNGKTAMNRFIKKYIDTADI
jgi:hypothetical protein